MSSLSEFAVFKHCVENPQKLDKQLSQLNLQFIKDPAAPPDQDPIQTKQIEEQDPQAALESKQRKAVRLFYQVWSGVTKCLRNIVQVQKKSIEIKDFAIFGPIFDKAAGTRDPNDKGIKNKNVIDRLGLHPVFVVINDDFLSQMDWQVAIDQNTDKAVGRFNKFERAEVNELFMNKIQPLSISSIASVCCTDALTVENVL